MRLVCLCLDAHNFAVGPAPRADEISRMMHRSHLQPPVPRQPASSLHAAKPNSHLRFGIAGKALRPASPLRRWGHFSPPKPLIVALNAARLGGAVPVFEPSAYCRRQSAKTGPRRGGARRCWRRFFCCGWKPSIGRLRDRHPRATLGSSLLRCRVLLHACCG